MTVLYKDEILYAHKQLHVLTLDTSSKLYINDDKLEVDERYLQFITRFLTNSNRYTIYSFLENVLGEYINNIVALKKCNMITSYDIETRRIILTQVNSFIEKSKIGFLLLKQNYPDYELLHQLINNFYNKISKHYFEP